MKTLWRLGSSQCRKCSGYCNVMAEKGVKQILFTVYIYIWQYYPKSLFIFRETPIFDSIFFTSIKIKGKIQTVCTWLLHYQVMKGQKKKCFVLCLFLTVFNSTVTIKVNRL